MAFPPLKYLHPDDSLNAVKLQQLGRMSTTELVFSLAPGESGSLKVRPDGTVLDGHHRLRILRDRGQNIELLQREIIERDNYDS